MQGLHSVVAVSPSPSQGSSSDVHPSSTAPRLSNVAWGPANSGNAPFGSGSSRSSGQRPSAQGPRLSITPALATRPPNRISQVRRVLSGTAWYHSPLAAHLRSILHGKIFAAAMIVALVLALFMHDLWILCGVNSDIEIDVVLSVVMFMFSAELVLLSVIDASYFLSFFFFMDIIGTISMVADISFMLGSSNIEAKSASDASAESNLMLLRATRAARVGARAGRLSRVVRILRFLPFLMGRKGANNAEEEKRGMAKAISSQLANLLATRVACLTILLVMVIPIFDVLTFPQGDYALEAWVERLSENLVHGETVDFQAELVEMKDFFSTHTYGPFQACRGIEHADRSGFTCTDLVTTWVPDIGPPPREASTLMVHTKEFMVAFNMHQTIQIDSLMGIMTIFFIVFIMVFSGLALASVVNELAVRPLERMLGTVKQIATTVFKFSAHMTEDTEDLNDVEGSSEMKLLEKVVAKLAIITELQTRDKNQAQNLDNINDEDIGILNMMQGKNLLAEAKKENERRESKVSAPRKLKGSVGIIPSKMDDASIGFPQEKVDSWAFNVIPLLKSQKTAFCIHTVSNFRDWMGCFTRGPEEDRVLSRFVQAAEKEYTESNPFHNFSHATDVLHAVSRMMNIMNSDAFLTELDQFCLLIAAIGHDLGHPGVNNGFLSEVSHELALQYNDRSPLENMHCAKLYEITTKEDSNIFAQLDKESYKDMRKMCIEAILHTDMMVHNNIVKDLQMLFQLNSEVFAGVLGGGSDGQFSLGEAEVFSQPESKMTTMDCLLHSADVSNPAKVWEVASAWAHRVLEEFFAQGDEEKRLAIPVQFLNDRDKLNRPNSQIGFIEFMIAPFFAAQIRLWPNLHALGDNLSFNVGSWENLWITETKPAEEDQAKVHARVTRVQESLEEAKVRVPKAEKA